MNNTMEIAFNVLKLAFGSHSAAAEKIGLIPCHYRAIRNHRVPVPKRTAELIMFKARESSSTMGKQLDKVSV